MEADGVTKEVPKVWRTRADTLNQFQHTIPGSSGPKRALLLRV